MWLRQDMTVTSNLLALIADAHKLFSRWVAALEHRSADIPDPSDLVALAELLRGEEQPSRAPSSEEAGIVHSVELPAAAVGEELPSAVVDLAASTAWAGEQSFSSTRLKNCLRANRRAGGIVVEPVAEQVAEMADMFADLSVAEELSSVEGTSGVVESAPVEPVAQAAPTLYDIFREEARGHLETLVGGYGELEANPGAPTSFEMTRAPILGGAGTVGLMLFPIWRSRLNAAATVRTSREHWRA
jgi:chemosensory pili system protein ChpA (sensor histidine kinase/response regulator)